MIAKSIAVMEHNNFFIGDAILNHEPDLAMFRYKNVNEKFMSHEKYHNIKMQASKGVFKSFNIIHIIL